MKSQRNLTIQDEHSKKDHITHFHLSFCISLLSALTFTVQDVSISNGLQLIMDGAIQYVLKDMSVSNVGQFKAENGTGVFSGNSGNRTLICGGIPRIFYHLFFFNGTATTEIYTLSLHDALPIHASSA